MRAAVTVGSKQVVWPGPWRSVFGVLTLVHMTASNPARATNTLAASVTNSSGGGWASSWNQIVRSTLGEPLAGISTSASLQVTAGFWNGTRPQTDSLSIFVTIQTTYPGLTITADGLPLTSPRIFTWNAHASHSIGTITPQPSGPGVLYVWTSWSEGGPITQLVAPSRDMVYTANFAIQAGVMGFEEFRLATEVTPTSTVHGKTIAGDTTWIADWTFDSGGSCDASGWTAFGQWGRMFQHITDNDVCSENTTCAWLFTDPANLATWPNMSFGPGGAVVRSGIDDVLLSPWVSLPSSPTDRATTLSLRFFPGNYLTRSNIVLGWSVRSKVRVPADSLDTVTSWAHEHRWEALGRFAWITSIADMTPFVDPRANEIQVGLRVADWSQIAGEPEPTSPPYGPGPYVDRVRIGRRPVTGPIIHEGIDSRSQAQDAFATVQNTVAPGQHFSPSADRYGTCAFSRSGDLGINGTSQTVVTGDSIHVYVVDARDAGGITSVNLYGAIVAGPHVGKAPAPYVVAGNGFFSVLADSCRSTTGQVAAGHYFVDFDDTYLRGGDLLVYFWAATDAGGGFSSNPSGLTSLPNSVAAAEAATGGLLEVSALPKIAWAQEFLDRIAADPHGDLDPTAAELAGSQQESCILYVQMVDTRRRSGPGHRTPLMYTLDELGYEGHYDVYDVNGYGNTNNQLASRASLAQLTGYGLIIQETGRPTDLALPSGGTRDGQKVNQSQMYRDYLAGGASNEIGSATLWLLGENLVESPIDPQLLSTMGATLFTISEAVSKVPDVLGQADFTWWDGSISDFSSDQFSLDGGCRLGRRNYDGLQAAGSGVVTHRYSGLNGLGAGAIVANKNAASHSNTILMSFNWFDVQLNARFLGPADAVLAGKILGGVLPLGCRRSPIPCDPSTPAVIKLYAGAPNPFNPTTRLRLDLPSEIHVRLQLFNVAGRRVRTLVDARMPGGVHAVHWNGDDDAGHHVASGVYFCRLEAGGIVQTQTLVLVE